MVAKKPRVVIIGAGMAGLTAAYKLYSAAKDSFDLSVVEGGSRIGGRINTSEFCGDRIEMGATWIHGIGGSPIYNIALQIQSLHSDQPWECMDGPSEPPTTAAEAASDLDPPLVDSVSNLFKNLMDFAQGKQNNDFDHKIAAEAASSAKNGKLSVGAFLRQGLEAYWKNRPQEEKVLELEEAVFAMHENSLRTYTSAGDLFTLDYNAESEYRMFPGEEITIAKGYISIIESLASILPPDLVKLGKKVTKIKWQLPQNGPVMLQFSDGSTIYADHVIVTVSLGVLKAGISEGTGLFEPPLPFSKTEAIKNLGFGVVNKLFLEVSPAQDFPFLQMAFCRQESKLRSKKIPLWMRRTATLWPIYKNSSVLLSWFAGEEALELENLKDEEIINGVSATVPSFLSDSHKFSKVLKSQWGRDPLFLGSYSYVATGSSGDDLDRVAEPLPLPLQMPKEADNAESVPLLQILFAGEATHRTHYSTTHGAYLSGLREANRLLQHYH